MPESADLSKSTFRESKAAIFGVSEEPALSEFPEPQNQIKRELDASDRDIIQLAPHPQSEPTADNDVYNTAPTSPTVFDPADDIDDPLVWHPSDTQWMGPGLTSLIFTASIARARIVLHKLQKLCADIPREHTGGMLKSASISDLKPQGTYMNPVRADTASGYNYSVPIYGVKTIVSSAWELHSSVRDRDLPCVRYVAGGTSEGGAERSWSALEQRYKGIAIIGI
ncbi:hypothetical protein C8J57DRAFT_1244137 [Mycena rebaudengoi]|nr:hypothetical protein C8J57DRAFT_1244137 [Mycena rebaudengoi]